MKIDVTKLKERGWTDHEIQQAIDTVKRAEIEKSRGMDVLDDNMYWVLMIVGVLGNIAFSVGILPAIIIIPDLVGYLLTGLTGLVFGMVFSMLVKNMEWIEIKHHALFTLIIPLAGFVNFTIIIRQTNYAVEQIGLAQHGNPFMLGIVYLVFFLLPYIVSLKGEKRTWKLEIGQ